MLETGLIVFHLLLAIGMIGLILLQHGKGADAGAAFGSGASATVFGARGSSNFLSRTTGILAALFFATSVALATFAMQAGRESGQIESVMEQPKAAAPETDMPVVSDEPAASSDMPAAGEQPAAPSDVPTAPAQ